MVPRSLCKFGRVIVAVEVESCPPQTRRPPRRASTRAARVSVIGALTLAEAREDRRWELKVASLGESEESSSSTRKERNYLY